MLCILRWISEHFLRFLCLTWLIESLYPKTDHVLAVGTDVSSPVIVDNEDLINFINNSEM